MKNRNWVLALGLAMLSVVAVPLSAQKTTSTTFNVTTVIHDLSSTGTQLFFWSDDYNGSGQATYQSTCVKNNQNCIRNSVSTTGGWQMLLIGQSVRTACVAPNNAINSSQPAGPPTECTWQNVEIYANCYDARGNEVPLSNVVTSSSNCRFGLDFYETSTGLKYKWGMSPLPQPNQICPAGGCPATGTATVTCNQVNGSQCVNWTVTPSTTGLATVANLFYFGGSGCPIKGSPCVVFIGQYYQTFRIDITNP
jgi:hypothetical protein